MKTTAKGAVMVGVDRPFEVREFPLTPPAPGMAQIELIASGICGTDLHIHRGKLGCAVPSIIGHEFVGKIAALHPADAGKGFAVGDRVIVDIAVPCGECLLCKTGDDANCVNMRVTNGGDINVAPYLYGGYAEVNYSPLTNLVPFPSSLDGRMVCTFACPGPTALHAFRLARQAGVGLGSVQTAVVQGLGPVGTFAVMYLKSLGIPHVYAVTAGDNEKREALARELGAEIVYNLTRTPASDITADIVSRSGLGADLVFEASGAPQAVSQGLDLLRNRGVYLVPGQYSNSGKVEIAPQLITFKALHIIGSSQYSVCDVRDYVAFLEAHPELHATIAKLGSAYKVEDINRAIEDAKSGSNIKTMLVR